MFVPARPLNPADRANTGLLLCTLPPRRPLGSELGLHLLNAGCAPHVPTPGSHMAEMRVVSGSSRPGHAPPRAGDNLTAHPGHTKEKTGGDRTPRSKVRDGEPDPGPDQG